MCIRDRKDAIYSVSKAWDAVKQTSLIHAWHKLLSGNADDKDLETETCVVLLHCATANLGNVDDDNINEWIESDKIILVIEFSLRRNFAGD